jgi:putative flippase GtrA
VTLDRRTAAEVLRFVLVGGANTFATGALFFALTLFLPTPAAYAVAYCCGIVLAGILIPTLVFGRPLSLITSGRVAAGYLAVLLGGTGLVAVLDDHLTRLLLVTVSLAVTVPANFAVSRALSRPRPT